MCGIVGGICSGNIRPFLVNGLKRLEYRGYDSAGIAVATDKGINRLVTLKRTATLRKNSSAINGQIGIGHTRWATHGSPSDKNAHPIHAGRVLVVHNGIIENHAELRKSLINEGRTFTSETDTETIAHLLDIALEKHGNIKDAWQEVSPQLTGAYAISAIVEDSEEILGVRHGSPLLLGEGKDGWYIASDAQALTGVAKSIRYMDNGDYTVIHRDGAKLYSSKGKEKPLALHPLDSHSLEVQLGEFTHFMQKEIFEQPDATAATMQEFVNTPTLNLRKFGAGTKRIFKRVKQVTLVACGTSYHAALIAGGWLENFGIPCRVEIASEFRYRTQPLLAKSLLITISQSGETADTLSALRKAKENKAKTFSIVNVTSSSMAREADYVFCTRAGTEIGVASTKAFTAQLTALLLITLGIAQARRKVSAKDEEQILHQLKQLPLLIRKVLQQEEVVKRWSHTLATAKSTMYIGRREHYPLALEGALKLKEISYIHAEGCPAGELKHGSLALVDGELPVVGLAPDNELLSKVTANLTEVATRGGRLYVLAGNKFHLEGLPENQIIRIQDDGGEYLSPIVYAVVLQLIAYHTAKQKGTDIDHPRNLAKAVTVE